MSSMEKKRRDLILLTALITLTVILAGVSIAIAHFAGKHDDEGSIGVFDVKVDKHARRWADIIFDHNIAVAAPGEVIAPPPATIEPSVPGLWRWRAPNVLRFEPAGEGFPIGQVYRITLNTKRLITSDQHFRGSEELTIRVDGLMVEKVITNEEGAADRKAVVLKGEIHFNYTVDPMMVITKTSIVDGSDRKPIEITSSSDGVIAFRTAPIAKASSERIVKLIVEKGLAERSRGAMLENDYVREIYIGSSAHLSMRSVTSGSYPTERFTRPAEAPPAHDARRRTTAPARSRR